MVVKTEFKVGLFIILTVMVTLAGLGYMAYKKGLFEAEQTITLSSRTGDGLTVGMPLSFSGFKIGRISELELSEQGIVLVKIRVPSQHFKWLRSDSRFILSRPLIGSTKLMVVTTNMASPPLTPQSTPSITEVNDINDTIRKFEPVIEKVALILDHIEKITGSLAGKQSLAEMAIADKESVDALYAALKDFRSITKKVDDLLKKTDDGLYGQAGIQPAALKVLQEIVADLQKVGKTLDNVTKISADTADATKDLKVLRSEIDATLKTANKLAEEITKKIPFKTEPQIKLP